MFPTLFDDDIVVTSVENGSSWRPGDLVVAEIEESSEDYVVKRLGQHTRDEITLISDNFLHYEPRTYPRDQVEIRGRVVKVIRTPERKSPHGAGEQGLVEFYQNPVVREVVELLPRVTTGAREPIVSMLREMAKRGV